jgi:NAD(P)H dehydrogenase (quinone)
MDGRTYDHQKERTPHRSAVGRARPNETRDSSQFPGEMHVECKRSHCFSQSIWSYGTASRRRERRYRPCCRRNGNSSSLRRCADALGRTGGGLPTYMAGVSAEFKAFEEATSNAVMAKGFLWKDKIAAGFTNSGAHAGDKLATLVQLALFAAQHGMHWVSLGLPPANNSTMGSAADLNRLGFWLGAGAQSNTDQGPEAAPPESDLATARYLGWRVAEATLQFVRGRTASPAREGAHRSDGRVSVEAES